MYFLNPTPEALAQQRRDRQRTTAFWQELFLFLHAYAKLLVFDFFLPRKGFEAIYEQVRLYPLRPSRGGLGSNQVCSAVDLACVLYWKQVLCLQRSVVTTCLLRSHGVPAQLVIGAQRMPFKAHAWVEVANRVVSDQPDMRELYQVITCC